MITTIALTVNVSASSDGVLLKKNNPPKLRVLESFNRASALNQGLKNYFKPIASVYRTLQPIKDGVATHDNLSNVCYSNNILQGDLVKQVKIL